MLQTPPAFIPPAVPLVPVAANGIVGTGGLLAGAAAGAAAGARVGSVFGPKGVVAGTVIGGLITPLLFPQPTAPGTKPIGLDPSLNDPEPSPEPAPVLPDRILPFEPKPGDPSTATYLWQVEWNNVSERGPRTLCGTGEPFSEGYRIVEPLVKAFTAKGVALTNKTAEYRDQCEEGNSHVDKVWWQIDITNLDGSTSIVEQLKARDGYRQSAAYDVGLGATQYAEVLRVTRDDEELPIPELPEPEVPKKPRPLPIPIRPLAPDPEPRPSPLEPAVVPLPQPVPGAPTVLPSPSPSKPKILPPQISPGTPGSPVIQPITPKDPLAVDPGTGVVPSPSPKPKPTPPGSHFPVPGAPPVTDGGTRADLAAIAAEVGRIEQKVQRIQNGEGSADLADWLWLLPLLEQFFEGDIPGTTYDLQGVCESVEPGQDQPVAEFPVAPAKNLGAIINRIDALPDVLQQHLAYRTPICHGSKKEGEFRTLSFISDEKSPNGDGRVAKRFRYRSSSGLGLPDIVNHWKDFVWQAGPVCVKHTDSPWGTPQVWAASIDEGKRVIRHAAGEAGIDPDQVGRWIVGGSHNPRYGVPGTMRINTTGGYYMITARDGASERPQVVIVPPDS